MAPLRQLYKLLNVATKPDLYPLLTWRISQLVSPGKKVFLKLDPRKGYYQVPVSPRDIEKTALWAVLVSLDAFWAAQ